MTNLSVDSYAEKSKKRVAVQDQHHGWLSPKLNNQPNFISFRVSCFMASYHYTEVKKEHDIDFPNACIMCRRKNPNDVYRINTWGLWRKPANEPLFKYFSVDVPACEHCKEKISKALWKTTLVSLGVYLSLGTLFALILLYTSLSEWLLITFLVVLIMAGAWLIDQICHPPITVMPYKEWLRFHFDNDEYGRAFYQLNRFKI